MNLGKVVGTVVSTQKESSMDGLKFMLVKHVDPEGKETGGNVVAVDAVGAGVGEYVLICTGSSARQTQATDKKPCDAVIMAIVTPPCVVPPNGPSHQRPPGHAARRVPQTARPGQGEAAVLMLCCCRLVSEGLPKAGP